MMIAECLFTSLAKIGDILLSEQVGTHVHLSDIGLKEGGKYPVQGIVFRDGMAWYYICDELIASYPKPYCSVFFQLDTCQIPGDWVLVPGAPAMIVPFIWAQSSNFMEKLVDGDDETLRTFARIRRHLV